jgi:hypothetical protein
VAEPFLEATARRHEGFASAQRLLLKFMFSLIFQTILYLRHDHSLVDRRQPVGPGVGISRLTIRQLRPQAQLPPLAIRPETALSAAVSKLIQAPQFG